LSFNINLYDPSVGKCFKWVSGEWYKVSKTSFYRSLYYKVNKCKILFIKWLWMHTDLQLGLLFTAFSH